MLQWNEYKSDRRKTTKTQKYQREVWKNSIRVNEGRNERWLREMMLGNIDWKKVITLHIRPDIERQHAAGVSAGRLFSNRTTSCNQSQPSALQWSSARGGNYSASTFSYVRAIKVIFFKSHLSVSSAGKCISVKSAAQHRRYERNQLGNFSGNTLEFDLAVALKSIALYHCSDSEANTLAASCVVSVAPVRSCAERWCDGALYAHALYWTDQCSCISAV